MLVGRSTIEYKTKPKTDKLGAVFMALVVAIYFVAFASFFGLIGG
jgi:hypothetical protein